MVPSPCRVCRRAFTALALLAAACAAPARAGADEEGLEYQVKAAFVCKFGNYVEWPGPAPGAAGEPLRIGVLGGDAVFDEFRRTAAATTVGGRPIEVRRLTHADSQLPEGLHIVFITRSMAAQSPAVLVGARGRPILTVTELDPPGAAAGTAGIINFVVVDNKVRFDILLPLAAQSGLKISGRLLGVARRVEGRG